MTSLAEKIAPYADDFRRDGFVMVPDLLSSDELARYGAAVDQAVARRKGYDTRAMGQKSLYEQSFIQCINLWEDSPAVRPLTFHPIVCETAARLLGVDALRLWHDQALYKETGTARPTRIRISPTGRCAKPTRSPHGFRSMARHSRPDAWDISPARTWLDSRSS